MKADRNDALLRKRLLFTALPLVALIVLFANWAVSNTPQYVVSYFSAALAAFLFALLGIRFIPLWMNAWSGLPETDVHAGDGRRSNRPGVLHPAWRIIAFTVLFRFALFLLAYVIARRTTGFEGGVFDGLSQWNPQSLDSRHYLAIAEDWYVNEGDARLRLVFLPFYPFIVRLLYFAFQDYLISGLFVSNVCCVLSCLMLYELALLDTDRRTAMRSVKFLCLLPASVLLSAPMSDSLFLLLTLLTMFCARRKRYPLACVCGFFAAFTRMLGVVLLAPVAFELIADIIRDRRAGAKGAGFRLACLGNLLSLLLIPLGFGLYLYINYTVSGNALQFLIYESEHWGQRLGLFFATTATQTDYLLRAVAEESLRETLGLWLPNLLTALSSLALVAAAQKKLRPAHTSFFIAYYLIGLGATWLLSAPRYLAACYPVSLALGALTEKRWANALATVLCAAGLLLYLYAFVCRWHVY